MHTPPESAPGPGDGRPPEGAWRHLQTGLAILGAILFGLGGLGLLWACLVSPNLGFGAEGPGLLLVSLAWRLFPLLPGVLLLLGARSLERPGAEASTSLALAAVGALLGLAWAAATVVVLLGGGLGG
jgi:hypothetical protein